jgi:hypothetical protein
MSNTRELINAFISGDSIAIENTFNSVMSDKVSQALDAYRVEVAQRMFDQGQEETADVNSTETQE